MLTKSLIPIQNQKQLTHPLDKNKFVKQKKKNSSIEETIDISIFS